MADYDVCSKSERMCESRDGCQRDGSDQNDDDCADGASPALRYPSGGHPFSIPPRGAGERLRREIGWTTMSETRQTPTFARVSIRVMEDFESCYGAVKSRDARFDGWFFTAVTSTRIYCRPSCPANTPKRQNLRFYPTAAAAQQAGFRACMRCRPDAAPGSPEWLGRADVAARAVKLILLGTVDTEGVSGLASRLGYSERQLHRVLMAEVGTGALALARAQRAQTARLLLETTDLPGHARRIRGRFRERAAVQRHGEIGIRKDAVRTETSSRRAATSQVVTRPAATAQAVASLPRAEAAWTRPRFPARRSRCVSRTVSLSLRRRCSTSSVHARSPASKRSKAVPTRERCACRTEKVSSRLHRRTDTSTLCSLSKTSVT